MLRDHELKVPSRVFLWDLGIDPRVDPRVVPRHNFLIQLDVHEMAFGCRVLFGRQEVQRIKSN